MRIVPRNLKLAAMKVTRNTTDQLIVEERPWLFGLMLIIFVLVFTGVGLSMIAAGEFWGIAFLFGAATGFLFIRVFVRRVQVIFNRPERWIEIRRRSMSRQSAIRYDLTEITQAEVETSNSGDGGPTHRVTLIIPKGQSAGRHNLTDYYVSGNGSHRAAKAINDWLDLPRTTSAPGPAPKATDR